MALGTGVLVIVVGARSDSLLVIATGFFAMGSGMAGYVPVQEVMWATFFGRRHLGSVRSSAMPFSLALGALGPILIALYHDRMDSYDGILVGMSGLVLVSAVLILFARNPARSEHAPRKTASPA